MSVNRKVAWKMSADIAVIMQKTNTDWGIYDAKLMVSPLEIDFKSNKRAS